MQAWPYGFHGWVSSPGDEEALWFIRAPPPAVGKVYAGLCHSVVEAFCLAWVLVLSCRSSDILKDLHTQREWFPWAA